MKTHFLAILALAVASSGCGEDDEEESGGDESGYFGLYMMVRNPSTGGGQCQTGPGYEWDIGSPAPTRGGSIGLGSTGNPVSGASCSVRSNGDFHVEATGTDPEITAPNGRIQIDFEGSAQTDATFTATVYTPVTTEISTTTAPCASSLVHLLEPGELWIDFECPTLGDPNRADIACQASGSLVLTSCGE